MYIPEEERIMGQKGFDTRFWKYKYSWVDKSSAGKKSNRFDRETGTYREGFSRQGLVKEAEVYIYPDTLTWLHDFSYSFNEPMFDTYFWHPAYGEYPVVGVNWLQAVQFAEWRTDRVNEFILEREAYIEKDVRYGINQVEGGQVDANSTFNTRAYQKNPSATYGGKIGQLYMTFS